MSWYAVEALDDAIETTKAFLLPVEARTWLKLAIIVLFLGGSSVSPPTGGGNTQFSGGEPGGSAPEIPVSMDTIVTLAIIIVAVAILLWMIFTLIGSLMEFAFVESLRSRDVHVRQYLRRYFGQGLRLFGFRFVLFTLIILPIVGFVLIFVPSLLSGSPDIALGSLFLFIPILLLLGLVVALVDGLTTNFVVPVMILQNRGVLPGWRAFWPTLRREWKQYGMYVLLRFALSIAAGIVVSLVGGIVSIVLLIPFAILGLIAYAAVGSPTTFSAITSNTPLLASFGLLTVVYGLLSIFAFAVIRVPVQTYLRYFSLLVLGDTNAEFDLIPELRETVR